MLAVAYGTRTAMASGVPTAATGGPCRGHARAGETDDDDDDVLRGAAVRAGGGHPDGVRGWDGRVPLAQAARPDGVYAHRRTPGTTRQRSGAGNICKVASAAGRYRPVSPLRDKLFIWLKRTVDSGEGRTHNELHSVEARWKRDAQRGIRDWRRRRDAHGRAGSGASVLGTPACHAPPRAGGHRCGRRDTRRDRACWLQQRQ